MLNTYRWDSVLQSYIQLTKPRIIILLLVTTAGGMWVASHGDLDPLLLLVTLVGGTLAAAAANTINCLYDRDIDAQMVRTQQRPIPSGRIQPRDACIFAIALIIASFTLLATYVNLAAAWLSMSGIGCYVLVYTFWLKRSTTQNIVIGGAAGAIPPLVGWAAVTGGLDWGAWILFVIILLWTPPHFWALALMIRDDYAQVGVPMLPVVVGDRPTAVQIFAYTLLLCGSTILLVFPFHYLGGVYLALAVLLGGIFIIKALGLLQEPSDRQRARDVFKYSILYMMLLCFGMGIDTLPWFQSLNASVSEQMAVLLSSVIPGA